MLFLVVISFQSMIGHCLGAAGGLEAIASVKAIETGWLHPSINQFVRFLFHFNNLVSDNVRLTFERRARPFRQSHLELFVSLYFLFFITRSILSANPNGSLISESPIYFYPILIIGKYHANENLRILFHKYRALKLH